VETIVVRLLKKKKSKRRPKKGRKGVARLSGGLRTSLRVVLACLCIGVIVVGGVLGTAKLERFVLGQPAFQTRPRITLLNVPEGLEETLKAVVDPVSQGSWADPALCERIATALSESGWVDKVQLVRRHGDGRVDVECAYRTPVALVQIGANYYAIDAHGVRLPGTYGYHPSLVMVQGVAERAPPAGALWNGGDVAAAVTIIELLHDEPFYDQVSGVLVGNYGGRMNREESHVQLATAPSGGRIMWGSAPGQEIEENSVTQKVALLRENFQKWGSIDAGRRHIDISVFPDRFVTRDVTSPDGHW